MRTLSASAALASTRSHDEAVIVCTLTFKVPSRLVLYLADRHVPPSGDIPEILPMVQNYGTLTEAVNLVEAGGSPSTAEVSLFNSKPVAGRDRLSDLIRTPGNTGVCYDFLFAEFQVDRLDPGSTWAQRTPLGVFFLEDPSEVGERILTLRMTDESLALDQTRASTTVITRELFRDCDPSAEGQPIAVPIGRLTNVPTQPIKAGRAGTLDGALDASTTTVTLTDATDFAAGDTVQADTEHITLGVKVGRTFTGCTRSANGTDAAAHDDDTAVYPLRPEYLFEVGEDTPDFPLSGITNIKVGGAPARTSPTVELVTNVLDDGTTRRFGVIRFTPADVAAFHTQPIDGVPLIMAGVFPRADSVIVSGGAQNWLLDTLTLPAIASAELGKISVSRRFIAHITWTGAFTNNNFHLRRGAVGSTVRVFSVGDTTVTPAAVDCSLSYDTGDSVASEKWWVEAGSGTSGTVNVSITEYSATVSGSGGQEGGSTAGRVIGAVTCDVLGVADSAPGTITPAPRALLENPVDVIRFLLTQRYGAQRPLGTSWATSRAKLDGHAWALLFGHDGAVPFDEFRQLVERQSRCRLILEGDRWELPYQDDDAPAAVALDYTRDVWAESVNVKRTERTRLYNSILVKSQLDWNGGSYARTARAEPPSLAVKSRIETTLELPWVQAVATADMLGAYWLALWKAQRWTVTLVAYQNVLALMKADTFSLANHPTLAAHGVAVFRITGKDYLLGDDQSARIKLTAIEVPA